MTIAEKQANMEMGSVDRMSELPEFILHIILSFLDAKAACRVNVLSKYWYAAWSSTPVLNFGPSYRELQRLSQVQLEEWYENGTGRQLVECVDATMLRYLDQKHRISKLNLQLPTVNKKIKHLVDKWIGIAVQNHVEELSFSNALSELPYRLPEIMFSAKSLKVLNCVNVSLPYYETIGLSSLESLTLRPINVDKDTLQRIITFCPLIDLDIVVGVRDEISLPWVEKGFETTRDFGGGSVCSDGKTSVLRRFSAASGRWNVNVGALRNLRKVEIAYAEITDDIVYEMVSGLVTLESLILRSCKLLRQIKISSFSLKEFHITQGDDLRRVMIDAPNLLEFGFNCGIKASVFLVRAHDSCNSQFSTWNQTIKTSWFLALKTFLLNTNIFSSLVMDFWQCSIVSIDVNELKNISTCAPYKLRELKLRHLLCRIESTLIDVLDGLFWSCHPDVLSITTAFQGTGVKSTEMILNFLKHKVQCWKHPLESIEVEGADLSNLLTEAAELEIRFRLSWKSC